MKWLPMSVHEECWNKNTQGSLLQPLLSQNHCQFSSQKSKTINYFAEIFLNDIFDAIDLGGSVFAGWSFFFGGWGGNAFPGGGML